MPLATMTVCSLGPDILLIQWFRPFSSRTTKALGMGVASTERYPYSRPASTVSG